MKIIGQRWLGQYAAWQIALLVSLFVFFMTIMIRTSWLGDDAYITLRTVDNFVSGYGLRWNISERVQSYTHALWMLLLIPVYAITQSHYYTPLVISWILSSLSAATLFFIFPRSFKNALLIALVMIFSKAVMDFSTSGLENPLTHALIVAFFATWNASLSERRKSFLMGLFAALLAMNRHDAILLAAPALLWEVVEGKSWRRPAWMLVGFAPFIAWEIFSIIYYGFPVPNTAYAKLNTAAPRGLLIQNGLYYILHCIMFDILTITTIAVVAIATLTHGSWKARVYSWSGLLYIAYITWAGGDFMSGRFFASPLFMAFAALTTIDLSALPKKAFGMIVFGLIAGGMMIRNPTVWTSEKYGKRGDISAHQEYRGVHDERSFYYQGTGLLARQGKERWPDHGWREFGEKALAKGEKTHEYFSIGMLGFFAGRNVHVIDILGLGDPLLARIQHMGVHRNDQTFQTEWGMNVRQGHFERSVPEGYAETLATGNNVIVDPYLREYYDHLSLVIRGPIWSKARWVAIWKLNTGQYQYLLDAYEEPEKYASEADRKQ